MIALFYRLLIEEAGKLGQRLLLEPCGNGDLLLGGAKLVADLVGEQQALGREDGDHVASGVRKAVAVDPHHHVRVEVEDLGAALDAAVVPAVVHTTTFFITCCPQ